ncbi:hypothetical protein [Murimonas intestini]|uniref:hypothetical protein n=1 Tax=Murimonas intestini TaxID=1337051 RepID=UPI0023EBD936|nr:hypothetical protein [Murimonas intestini]
MGMMKRFMEEFGEWLRHKIRVIVMKQWKRPKTIYRNLNYLNQKNGNGFNHEAIFKVSNSRLGWYRRSGVNVVNFIISKDLLENRIKDGAGLLNPLSYYLSNQYFKIQFTFFSAIYNNCKGMDSRVMFS